MADILLRHGADYNRRRDENGAELDEEEPMNPGDIVYILEGDEKGSWGIVHHYDGDNYHVAYAGGPADRIYTRDELRRPRNQEQKRRELGITN